MGYPLAKFGKRCDGLAELLEAFPDEEACIKAP